MLKIDPHHPIVNLELGIIKNSRRQFDQAIRHLEKTLRMDGRLADAHVALVRDPGVIQRASICSAASGIVYSYMFTFLVCR